MKKALLGCLLAVGLFSCGGYTDEQGKAAEAMCNCMENDPYGDFDINFYECDLELQENYGPETFEEGSWLQALEEKCPDVAEKMSE